MDIKATFYIVGGVKGKQKVFTWTKVKLLGPLPIALWKDNGCPIFPGKEIYSQR